MLLVQYTDGPYYILGSLSNDNYTIPTPLEPQCPCGENTSNSNVLATLLKGVDGITPDMSDYYDKGEIEGKLSQKQDVINDLEAIRSGASKGTTALQRVPSEYVTESELQGKGYATTAQVDAKQDTISDLEAIRQGAAKGATALQSETYTGTVTGVKVNGSTKNPTNGIVDIGTVITSHQDISGKQDKITDLDIIRSGAAKGATALQEHQPLKTINGEPIVGSGNITIKGGGEDNVQSDWEENDSSNGAYIKGRTHYFKPWVEEQLLVANGSTIDTILFSVGAYFKIGSRVYSTERMLNEEFNCADAGPSIIVKVVLYDDGYTFGVKHISGSTLSELPLYYVAEVDVKYIDDVYIPENIARYKDGYVYSNGEKVDMRFTRSLIPVGTSIPANANLNTVAYLKVGKYYCSQNVDAKTITNCPSTVAFSMEVFNPLSPVVDNETTAPYVYRIRILTVYNTGVQYIQYCTVGSKVNKWTYNAWYVLPRSPFTLNSNKKGGSAALGSATQGVYINSEGTFVTMKYTLGKSVPSSAEFTDTKVTAVGNHYTPVENESVAIAAGEGEVVIGLKRDAAGHIVGVETTSMTDYVDNAIANAITNVINASY